MATFIDQIFECFKLAMTKILVICGPTAAGKTKLALKLAKKFDGELVSADSRQVYKRLDIGTGKELPAKSDFEFRNPKLGGVYVIRGIPIWGYDLVSPSHQFSVAQYKRVVDKIIDDITNRGKLPILVGGTGLYIKCAVDGLSTVGFPINKRIRRSLAAKNVEELYELLGRLDALKAASLNISDRQNPRRLIRAIEIAQEFPRKAKTINKRIFNALFIGLKTSRESLNRAIDERVGNRVRQGVEKEIKKLLETGVRWEDQSMSSLGYRQWRGYFEKKTSLGETITKWRTAEHNYAKRQMTWFAKDKRLIWFEIGQKKLVRNVENTVKKWYNSLSR